MRRYPLPTTPRIIDYHAPVTNISIEAYQELAWPCLAFRVTLPVNQRWKLNIFEETILKLASIGVRNADAMAHTTCLPRDLVVFVIRRLQDQGIIQESLELTELGTRHLARVEAGRPQYEIRTLFREVVGGNLLPVLSSGSLTFEALLSWSDSNAIIQSGSAGNSQGYSLHLLQPDSRFNVQPPSPNDVLWTVRQHRALSHQQTFLSGGRERCPAVQVGSEVSLDPQSELVFLRCQAIIQSGSSDFLITDPFGYGCSDVLGRAYMSRLATDREEEQIVLRLKQKASSLRVVKAERSGMKMKDSATQCVPMEARRKYPDLNKILHLIINKYEGCLKIAESSDEEMRIEAKRKQVVIDLYSALEWGLAYAIDASKANKFRDIFSRGSHETNGDLLKKMARKLCLNTESIGHLLEVVPGRIEGLRNGVMDMQALLALTIAAAANDFSSPFRAIALQQPDWLQFLKGFRQVRNAVAHGQMTSIRKELLEDFRAHTFDTLGVLLPDLRSLLVSSDKRATVVDSDIEYENRLRARISLERQFGIQGYARLGSRAAELLLQVESWCSSVEIESSTPLEVKHLVVNLSSALQCTIHQMLIQFRGDGADKNVDLIRFAAGRAVQFGFLLNDIVLPKCLATVRIRRVQQALNGLSPSLGACTLGLLISAPADWMSRLSKVEPNFVLQCAHVSELRGHGNEPLRMPFSEFAGLKEPVYRLIRHIMEA
jgi:hypothetical protein